MLEVYLDCSLAFKVIALKMVENMKNVMYLLFFGYSCGSFLSSADAVCAKRSPTLLNAHCSTHKKQQSPPTREHRSPTNHHQTSYDISHQEFMTEEETPEAA